MNVQVLDADELKSIHGIERELLIGDSKQYITTNYDFDCHNEYTVTNVEEYCEPKKKKKKKKKKKGKRKKKNKCRDFDYLDDYSWFAPPSINISTNIVTDNSVRTVSNKSTRIEANLGDSMFDLIGGAIGNFL